MTERRRTLTRDEVEKRVFQVIILVFLVPTFIMTVLRVDTKTYGMAKSYHYDNRVLEGMFGTINDVSRKIGKYSFRSTTHKGIKEDCYDFIVEAERLNYHTEVCVSHRPKGLLVTKADAYIRDGTISFLPSGPMGRGN